MVNSYSTLPLGKFLACARAEREERNDLLLQARKVAICYDMDFDTVVSMPLRDYEELLAGIKFLWREPPGATGKRVAKSYVLGGRVYVPTLNLPSMTTAQYIDYNELCKMEGDNIVELLACLLVPQGKQYGDGYDVLDVRRDIADYLSYTDASELCAFFLTCWAKSVDRSLLYLAGKALLKGERELMRKTVEARRRFRHSFGNGVGLMQSVIVRI